MDPELAEDALQETFYALARIKDPSGIKNLRAYFYRVLIRVVHQLRSEDRRTNLETLLEWEQYAAAGPGQVLARPADESARLAAEGWLKLFSAHRERLTAAVPGRSPDPGRYRNLNIAVTERILGAMPDQGDSEPDSSGAFRAGYPEWFDEAGCAPANLELRLARARSDVRNLLLVTVESEVDVRAVYDAVIAYAGAQAAVQAKVQRDEQVRAADDAILGALFRGAEQILLAHEAPYNLERELELFTEWLDSER